MRESSAILAGRHYRKRCKDNACGYITSGRVNRKTAVRKRACPYNQKHVALIRLFFEHIADSVHVIPTSSRRWSYIQLYHFTKFILCQYQILWLFRYCHNMLWFFCQIILKTSSPAAARLSYMLPLDLASGFIAINAVALNDAISGSIFPVPLACFVITMALPFGSTRALPTHQFIIFEPLWIVTFSAIRRSMVLIAPFIRHP